MTEERFEELEAWARGERVAAISREETLWLIRERRRLVTARREGYQCPHCGHQLGYPERRQFVCPACEEQVTIPLSQG